jgi:hypothetical protein
MRTGPRRVNPWRLAAHGACVLARRARLDPQPLHWAWGVVGRAWLIEDQADVANPVLGGRGDGVAGPGLEDADSEAA